MSKRQLSGIIIRRNQLSEHALEAIQEIEQKKDIDISIAKLYYKDNDVIEIKAIRDFKTTAKARSFSIETALVDLVNKMEGK